MWTMKSISFLTLISCYCFQNIRGNPVGTSVIDCNIGSNEELGPVDEGFSGIVEEFTGVTAEQNVQLSGYIFPSHINHLELTISGSTATIRTKNPLDADAFREAQGKLYYSLKCGNNVENTRSLTITDENDNSPVFDREVYNKEIKEIEPVGSAVITVTAVDADATEQNNRVTYSALPPLPSDFEVKPDGRIILTKRLNYNVASSYRFTVEARDNGNRNDTALVHITVLDFDNMNPYFNHSLYTAVIKEHQTGEFLSILPEAIQAKDGDSGINQPIVYSISAVSPSKYRSHFSISQDSGVITVVSELDREEVGLVTVNIKAAQNDDSLKTAEAVVSVTIEDVNDNPPEFDKSSYSATVLENSPVNSLVLTARVTDRDEGGFNGTLRIIPESSPFSVSPDGTVRVKNSTALDREKTAGFVLEIEARETAAPNNVASVSVNITLLDENDNTPLFGSALYEGKLFKNQTVGMNVITVEAVDPDEGANGKITYSIDGGNQGDHFSINPDTGEIKLEKEVILQENRVLEFFLYVTAKDGGQVSRLSTTQVHILAPGDSKPQFLRPTYHGSVQEEKDAPVDIVQLDSLSAAPVTGVTLEVLNDKDKFSIDNDGMFSTRIKLDHEAQKNYTVKVSISDGTSRDEATVLVDVIDINDNDPVFTESSVTVSVPEDMEVSANVTIMTATDADDGFNGKISYSLLGGEGRFGIDPKSGRITLARELDREVTSQFSLSVIARDQGQPPRSATATVTVNVTDINDNSPQFPMAQYKLDVPENSSVGTTVLKLKATDLDQGLNAVVTYRILQQDPNTDPPVFILDQTSGNLWLNQPLDFGKGRLYTLAVGASDGGNPQLNGTCSVLVTVSDVNNNAPKFSQDSYDVTAFENLPGGTAITTLKVTDEDEDGFSNGHFLMISDTFNINKQGTVSLNSNATLDREEQANYILQVVAVDSPTNGLSATAQLNITILDVNDNNPQFLPLPHPIEIAEGNYTPKSPGEVCQITATDADEGANSKVTMSLSKPSTLFTFREDGTLLAVGTLDREVKDVYNLVIVASDNGTPQMKNFTEITVTITDVNDNDPKFSQETYTKDILLKDAKEGDLVLTLLAIDKDFGNNSLITYSFTAGSSLLKLNSETGEITLTSDISDIIEDTLLNLTALAKDHGKPSLNSTAAVRVSLFTVGLTPSVEFESSTYNFSVAENELEGTVVGEVKASAGSSLVQITYSLRSHNDLFSMDEQGKISTIQVLDQETQAWYNMEVEAVDSRDPPNTGIAMVMVQVKDVNEPPEFGNKSCSAKIFSIAPYKSPIVQVKATDQDLGDNGRLEYSLDKPSPLFDVDPSTGQVYVLSVEGEEGLVSLRVKATDPRGLSATTDVEVMIQESNSKDVVVISLNQPANIVEKKMLEMEGSLKQALGWTVKVISITSSNTFSSGVRSSRDEAKTYVSFIAMEDDDIIVSSKEVEKKLESEREAVNSHLQKVFGSGLEHTVQVDLDSQDSSQESTIIALGVVLALCILGLVVMAVVMALKLRKPKEDKGDQANNLSFDNPYTEHRDSDSESYSKEEPSRKSSNAHGSNTSAL